MSVAVKTFVPEHTSNYGYHRQSRSSSISTSERKRVDLLTRINDAEIETRRPRSHSHSLVHIPSHTHHRSISDINAEIEALEAQKTLERERAIALEIRDRERELEGRRRESHEYEEIIEERTIRRVHPRHHHHHHHHRDPHPEQEVVVYEDRERSRSKDYYLSPKEYYVPWDELVYERRRSPPRNVVRVEKDRKGRLALVRSTH